LVDVSSDELSATAESLEVAFLVDEELELLEVEVLGVVEPVEVPPEVPVPPELPPELVVVFC